jgi:hypothetical protein
MGIDLSSNHGQERNTKTSRIRRSIPVESKHARNDGHGKRASETEAGANVPLSSFPDGQTLDDQRLSNIRSKTEMKFNCGRHHGPGALHVRPPRLTTWRFFAKPVDRAPPR